MTKKETKLKTILKKYGLNKYVLVAEAQGTALRLPPKSRYAPARVLHPPPRHLVLIHSEMDELIKSLNPDSLEKLESLTKYLLKQIKNCKKYKGD